MKTINFGILVILISSFKGSLNLETSCSFPGSPAHSSVIFSENDLRDGTVATYSCDRGFELLGPARRICHNGTWIPEGIPFCVLNVAAGKAPMQISTENDGIPQKAVDGSTTAFFNADTCSLTKPELLPWWYVNLLEPYMVQLVRLDFGKSCCGNKPATIVVRVGNNRPDLETNPICNRFTGFLEEGQPLFLPCNPPMPGAFVSVHLEASIEIPLSVCEAFVYTDQALPIERCPSFRDHPPGALASYNGKCYTFYDKQFLNFREALAFCRSRGGTLINESNPALQGFISWELWRRHRTDVLSQYWMGAKRDSEDRNIWKWTGGKEVTVSFWDNLKSNEDCARYDGSKGWLWSDTSCDKQFNFICQHKPKACGRPEQPPYSTMTVVGDFGIKAVVKYACDSGYFLVGPSTRTCLETGFYDEFPPVCKYIDCGFPASVANGSNELINDTTTFQSLVRYKCDEGYEMIGRAVLMCGIDERWDGPPPKCEAIECDKLPENYYDTIIYIANRTLYNSKAKISCPKGYRLDGPEVITCLSSGQWSNPLPKCIKVRVPSSNTSTTIAKPGLVTLPIQTTERTKSFFGKGSNQTTNQDIKQSVVSTDKTPDVRGVSRDEFPSKKVVTPTTISVSNISPSTNNYHNQPHSPPSFLSPTPPRRKMQYYPVNTTRNSFTKNSFNKVLNGAYPQENEVIKLANTENDRVDKVYVPIAVEKVQEDINQAKLNVGAVIALGTFGGFVFLAATITTIIIFVKRSRTTKHYRHRASPDCNTVASYDSSTSGSRNGLNRYYRQAWESLHESTVKENIHNPLRRKETLDHLNFPRSRDDVSGKSRSNVDRCGCEYHDGGALRDGVELMISDACFKHQRKRHHHHHKSGRGLAEGSSEYKDHSVFANQRPDKRHNSNFY